MSVNVLSEMIGATIERIDEGEDMVFHATDGRTFRFHHWQDCCESVRVEDICGDSVQATSEDRDDGAQT